MVATADATLPTEGGATLDGGATVDAGGTLDRGGTPDAGATLDRSPDLTTPTPDAAVTDTAREAGAPDLCAGAAGQPAGTKCGCGAAIDCSGACRPSGTCNALDFDGVSGLVSAGLNTQIAMAASGTMEAWVQVRSHAENAYIFRKSRANVEDKALLIEGGYTRAYFFLEDVAYAEAVSRTVVPLQAWTHIAAVYDGTTMRIYLNGQLTDTVATPGARRVANSDGEVLIGGRPNIFNGIISDVRISSSGRYTANFTPAALLVPDNRTLALWRLDEGTGTTVADLGPARLMTNLVRASPSGGPLWVRPTPRF
jgi:hypothetical protein